MMQTSLKGISNKAKCERTYRYVVEADIRGYFWQGFSVLFEKFGVLKPRITERKNYQITLFKAHC